MNIANLIQPNHNSAPSWRSFFTIKEDFGQGTIGFYTFDNQLCLSTINSTFSENILIEEDNRHPHLVLNFLLKGSYNASFNGTQDIRFTPGSMTFFSFLQQNKLFAEKDKQTVYLSIFISPAFLASMAGFEESHTLDSLRKKLEQPGGENSILYQGKYDPRIHMILYEILNPPFAGRIESESVNHIFLKSKLLELIALFFNSFTNPPEKEAGRLKSDEFEKLQLAKEILVSEIDNPPSLADLSRRIFLNEFKLKKGFKHLFGTTVYEYVRNHRLNEAKRLLEQGDMNVSEISLSIGYNNPSHFAASFKNKFGISPGELLVGRKKYLSF